MAENTPLYESISNVYNGPALGVPNRDLFGQGVVLPGDLLVSAHAAANSIDVAAGTCWVVGDTDVARQPTYRCFNDAIVNLGVSPDPTNPRKVRVVGQVNDADFAGGTRNWVLQALHGTPAGSPVDPAEPASAITLATILVPAAAASSAAYTITDARPRAMIGRGQVPAGVLLRKVTPKVVVNTVVETDLLNGELVLPAGALGVDRVARLTLRGDWIQNSGAARDVPRFKIKLGATTLLDTNITGALVVGPGAFREPWRLDVTIANLGAANSQWVQLAGFLSCVSAGVFGAAVFTTGNGTTTTLAGSGTAERTVSYEGSLATAVDTSVAQALACTVTNPAASAALDVTLQHALVEIL